MEFTTGQLMTLRVALMAFQHDLLANGLGDDEVGKGICAGYLARIDELLPMLIEEERLREDH